MAEIALRTAIAKHSQSQGAIFLIGATALRLVQRFIVVLQSSWRQGRRRRLENPATDRRPRISFLRGRFRKSDYARSLAGFLFATSVRRRSPQCVRPCVRGDWALRFRGRFSSELTIPKRRLDLSLDSVRSLFFPRRMSTLRFIPGLEPRPRPVGAARRVRSSSRMRCG